MKIFKTLSALVLSVTILQANEQTDVPKGFSKGSLVLADNNSVTGYIKDNSRRDAAVVLFKDGKETTYKDRKSVV